MYVLGHRQWVEVNYQANPQLVQKVLQDPTIQIQQKIVEEACLLMENDLECLKKSGSRWNIRKVWNQLLDHVKCVNSNKQTNKIHFLFNLSIE